MGNSSFKPSGNACPSGDYLTSVGSQFYTDSNGIFNTQGVTYTCASGYTWTDQNTSLPATLPAGSSSGGSTLSCGKAGIKDVIFTSKYNNNGIVRGLHCAGGGYEGDVTPCESTDGCETMSCTDGNHFLGGITYNGAVDPTGMGIVYTDSIIGTCSDVAIPTTVTPTTVSAQTTPNKAQAMPIDAVYTPVPLPPNYTLYLLIMLVAVCLAFGFYVVETKKQNNPVNNYPPNYMMPYR
jgi:hypothetical protein